MFRLRRYRLYLLVAVLTTATIWHLTRVNNWGVSDLEGLARFSFKNDATIPKPAGLANTPPPVTPEQPIPQPMPVVASPSPLTPTSSTSSSQAVAVSTSTPFPPQSQSTVTGEEFLAKKPSFEEEFGQRGQGRYDVKPRPSSQPRAYWKQQKEHFPVPAVKLIPLPSGNVKPLPKIQHTFSPESSSRKADRVRKQTAIRESFKHAWAGYKTHAFGHDELKPVSNDTANPFNGWGATLVDSLDTLWIMGLRAEFEEAVHMVSKIQFNTSPRKDIPLFETTIRYLGGLLSAYDLSLSKYPVLLEKAVQLADVLMGAFDTPNRMPIPFYHWAPSYASQPHRSSAHIVLAELGSLAVEFTRLAQVTKEAKYYDAIARVTNALEEWQMKTALPGVWPVRLDASGCKKPERVTIQDDANLVNLEEESTIAENAIEDLGAKAMQPDRKGPDPLARREAANPPAVQESEPEGNREKVAEEFTKFKDVADLTSSEEINDDVELEEVDCETQGLTTEPNAKLQTYSIAAMADSTYEYFPKEYALLGGLNEQYRTMYMDAMEVIRRNFLYRPMTKEKTKILFLAKHEIAPQKISAKRKHTVYEGTHLGCFVGGMFALGSKVFGIPSDMALAEQLTEGCVWAYDSTPLGIMAEEFSLVPCDDRVSCPWNETKWHEWLDPNLKERIEAVEMYNIDQEFLLQQTYPDDLHANPGEEERAAQQTNNPSMSDPTAKRKRQAGPEVERLEPTKSSPALVLDGEANSLQMFVPKVALSHKKYVAARISEERLPPGYTKIGSREYKLRPEAIESVFIMFRLTGAESWREKGWKMFSAIERATKTSAGNAAVKDVTSQLMELTDTMESFWLAETLKYFYLLFSEPDLISLDDYVFNTEAHPFKLPK